MIVYINEHGSLETSGYLKKFRFLKKIHGDDTFFFRAKDLG